MEAAPLTQAWQYAKEASIATANSDTTAALTSHAQAAGEFAKAAASTSSNEAIRTLRLLENHHRKLGELLQFPKNSPVPNATVGERLEDKDAEVTSKEEKPVSTSAAVAELRAKAQNTTPPQTKDTTSPSNRRTTTSTFPRRLPPREMSSSIASNLASARGIRSASTQVRALSPSMADTQAIGTMGPPPRRRPNAPSCPNAPSSSSPSQRPSWLPPTENDATIARRISRDLASQHSSRRSSRDIGSLTISDSSRDHARDQQTTIAEEGFAKFYSAFESLKSKLSAPLAFAGLPLISEESDEAKTTPTSPTAAQSAKFSSGKRHSTTTAESDLTKYFSKAAIKASLTTSQAAVNDSFYVVPTSGGTVSYAQMVGYDESSRQRGEQDEDDEGDEDFVDAREHPVTLKRSSFAGSFGRRGTPTEYADAKVGLSRKSSAAGSQANQLEELVEKNKFLEQAVIEMRDALAKEKQKLRTYQSQSQAGMMAVQRLMEESGVRSAGNSIHQSIHQSMMAVNPGGSCGGWTEQVMSGGGNGGGGVDVEMLRKEIQDLRAEVGREKRTRRKLESDAMKESVAREREREVTAKEMERLRREMEGYKGEAMKLRMLEKSAREKAEKRRKEERAGKGSKDIKDGGIDDTGSRANDSARFVSG